MAQKEEIGTTINKKSPLTQREKAVLKMYNTHQIKGEAAPPFPLKLQILLKIVHDEGHDDMISWLPHGRAFGFHKPRLFEHEIMKRFFKQSQIASFRRQLNLYGFIRLSSGSDKGT